MLAGSTVLSEFFARHPSSIGASGIGGHYRVICEGCGTVLSVAIPEPAPETLELRCEHCDWRERLGVPEMAGAVVSVWPTES
ncbi:MAG TPA: hypothetical protein VFW96_23625 [Thermomicrobiales bacterium]|nr:hypothetical protein [Thermomicrobiales bacterium]